MNRVLILDEYYHYLEARKTSAFNYYYDYFNKCLRDRRRDKRVVYLRSIGLTTTQINETLRSIDARK